MCKDLDNLSLSLTHIHTHPPQRHTQDSLAQGFGETWRNRQPGLFPIVSLHGDQPASLTGMAASKLPSSRPAFWLRAPPSRWPPEEWEVLWVKYLHKVDPSWLQNTAQPTDPLDNSGMLGATPGAHRTGCWLLVTTPGVKGDRPCPPSLPPLVALYLPPSAIHPFCSHVASGLTLPLLLHWFLRLPKIPQDRESDSKD